MTCRQSDIRWAVLLKERPEGGISTNGPGIPLRFLYYFVDELGSPYRLDDSKKVEDAIAKWGDEYYCLGCDGNFLYWSDVEEHLDPDHPELEARDENDRPRMGRYKHNGKWE